MLDKDRRVPNIRNRVDPTVESAVIEYAVEQPAHGKVRVSNELRKRGVFVSASGVRSIWLRNSLANMKQRLKALEAKVAQEGLILTEAQVQALERKNQHDEACGEIETAHPGYLGSQDTFMWAHSKVLDGFISKPTSTLTPRSLTASSIQRKRRLPQPIC